MNNYIEYKGKFAFHPGYYIAGVIDDMGITHAEFAQRLGTTAKTLSTIINGRIGLSDEIAEKLSVMLGTSVSVWMNLQMDYNRKILEIEREKKMDEQMETAAVIDYSFFVKTAGLSETKNPFEKISNLCSYLHVSDLRILSEPDFLVNYRSVISEKEMKNIVNSRAWLQTALNLSKDIKTKPFNCGNLKASLSEIRGMTIQEPEVFIPRLREIFSECGVAFVILPHLKNSGINGAVKWINSDRALLAVNNRGLDADKFWFSLFHEIKHVLQQKVKAVFVMADVTDMTDLDSKYEKEADKFAADFLIPPSEYKKFSPTKFTTDGEIIEFAESIGIHPSIVAARMQHDKIIPQNRCSGLKKKYHIL